ncbi:MAG TPA: inner membrane-spanning protein YciB [Caulobacteraceae bacterium]|nr:inner membrane-spanning protein YciB [Caulobacteraceae bacterium]
MANSNTRWVRTAVDYGAPIAFAVTFFASGRDFMLATWVLVGASILALLLGFIVERRIAPLPLLAGGFALVFGGLTLWFDDPMFVKLKVSVVNLIFATLLLGGVMLGKNPVKALLGDNLSLPDDAWKTLTIRYGLYFVAVAIANEFVWRTQSDDTWVAFRIALLPAALIFSIAQAPYLMKHMKRAEAAAAAEPPDPGF